MMRHQRSQSEGGVISLSDRVTAAAVAMPNNGWEYERPPDLSFHLASDTDEGCIEAEMQQEGAYTDSDAGETTFRTNGTSPEFVRQLLAVLFAGITPPEPMFIEALVNDPPYGFFSPSPPNADDLSNLQHNPRFPRRRSRFSTTMRSGLERLLSPIRKKTLRPSTTSLPAEMATTATVAVNTHRSRGEHWWSMVQLADAAAAARIANPLPPVPPRASTTTDQSPSSEPIDPSGAPPDHQGEPSGSTPQKEALSPVPSAGSPTKAAEARIAKLKRDVNRLETTIGHVKSQRSGKSHVFKIFVFFKLFLLSHLNTRASAHLLAVGKIHQLVRLIGLIFSLLFVHPCSLDSYFLFVHCYILDSERACPALT